MGSASALWNHRELLAELTGSPVDEATGLLELIDDRSCWMLGPVDGAWVIRLVPGPGRPGARLTLYRLDPDAALPEAADAAEECVVLSGSLRDGRGRELHPGERVRRDEGGWLCAGPDAECICCVLVPGEAERRATA